MILSPVVLTGRHVRLEPVVELHLESLARHATAEVWEHLPLVLWEDETVRRAWLTSAQREQENGTALTFAVVSLANGEAVGATSYFDVSASDRRLEIGRTWLAQSVWRTAVNTECKLLLLRHAFEQLGCLRVQLKTDNRNVRSQAAIERLGAVKEGVLRAHMRRRDGTQRDTVMYSIVATEWPIVKTRLEQKLAR